MYVNYNTAWGLARAEGDATLWEGGAEATPETHYQLSGIVVHSGQASGGHYYSYVLLGMFDEVFDYNLILEYRLRIVAKNCRTINVLISAQSPLLKWTNKKCDVYAIFAIMYIYHIYVIIQFRV